MKISRAVLLHICTLSLLLFQSSLVSSEEKILNFCYDPYPPYTLGEVGKPIGGIKVELLEAVVEQIEDLDAKVELLPWKRCQAEARSGNFDGILPLFKNDERQSYMVFTNPIFPQMSTFWYKKKNFPDGLKWENSFTELGNLKLGMLNGSFIDADMESAFENKQGIQRARDMDSLLGLLLKDRVDLIAIDDNVGRYLVRKKKLDGIVIAIEKPIHEAQSFFGLSKASGGSKYVGSFNDAIAILKQNGTIEKIRLGE